MIQNPSTWSTAKNANSEVMDLQSLTIVIPISFVFFFFFGGERGREGEGDWEGGKNTRKYSLKLYFKKLSLKWVIFRM